MNKIASILTSDFLTSQPPLLELLLRDFWLYFINIMFHKTTLQLVVFSYFDSLTIFLREKIAKTRFFIKNVLFCFDIFLLF